MPTYAQVQAEVRRLHGFVPKTCWIAHVLSDHGSTGRLAPNRLSLTARKHPCPDAKRAAIEEILRRFRMIS